MRQKRVGVPVEANSNEESTFVLKIEKTDQFAVLTNSDGKYLTAQGEAVVLTDTLECPRDIPETLFAIRLRSQKVGVEPGAGRALFV